MRTSNKVPPNFEGCFQNIFRFNIQVIGRLIHQQYIDGLQYLYSAKRLRSPPDNTFTFFSTSSPLKERTQHIPYLERLVSVAASSIVCNSNFAIKIFCLILGKVTQLYIMPSFMLPLYSNSLTIAFIKVDFP
jgi:hypothetical protein